MKTRDDFRRERAQVLALLEASTEFTDGEKQWVKCVVKECGSFYACLYETACWADWQNRQRLSAGFPEFMAACKSWHEGDLFERVTAFGLDIY